MRKITLLLVVGLGILGIFVTSFTRNSRSLAPIPTLIFSNASALSTCGVNKQDQIVFVGSTQTTDDIYVSNYDGSRLIKIPSSVTHNMNPSISSDNQFIAYASENGFAYNIIQVRIDGSSSMQLTSGTYYSANPAYSPDGKYLAYSSNQSGYSEVYLMDLKGKNSTPLTKMQSRIGGLSWSPDSSELIFASDQDGDWEIKKDYGKLCINIV